MDAAYQDLLITTFVKCIANFPLTTIRLRLIIFMRDATLEFRQQLHQNGNKLQLTFSMSWIYHAPDMLVELHAITICIMICHKLDSHAINSYSASHDNWCTDTLWNRVITAQCEGMGEVGSARYELALLPPCPSIRVLCYSNCQRSTNSSSRAWQCKC